MRTVRALPLIVSLLWLSVSSPALCSAMPASDQAPPASQQSRTGPYPPFQVVLRDVVRGAEASAARDGDVVLAVPSYLWRHGCGPTALGMVAGYWDGRGYGKLIAGESATQTTEVDQAIASGGKSGSPFPPGQERHYEDYAVPEDAYPNMRTDAVAAAGRKAHTDDSLADFMKTSRSASGNYYGWSWAGDVGLAWNKYVGFIDPAYGPSHAQYFWSGSPTLSWDALRREIDSGRPMVFLVDSNGDGGTDHFVAVIGYRENPRQYASRDTWWPSVRWENFAGIQSGVPWGIWGGTAFTLAPAQQDNDHKIWLPIVRE